MQPAYEQYKSGCQMILRLPHFCGDSEIFHSSAKAGQGHACVLLYEEG